MTAVKIYYNQFHGYNFKQSPFSLDGVGYDIQSLYSLNNSSHTYGDCPSWKHKATRTFVVRSPIDLSFIVDKKTQTLECFDIEEDIFKEYFHSTFNQDNWCNENGVTIQLTVPRFLLWTESKNIWIEQRPHPITSAKNNFVCVNGWFNLSSWSRTISFALDIFDHTQPVVIKRGDILFELCFYSSNLNEGFILKKSEIPESVIDNSKKRTLLKDYSKKFSNYLPFKKQLNKCPFEFIWK